MGYVKYPLPALLLHFPAGEHKEKRVQSGGVQRIFQLTHQIRNTHTHTQTYTLGFSRVAQWNDDSETGVIKCESLKLNTHMTEFSRNYCTFTEHTHDKTSRSTIKERRVFMCYTGCSLLCASLQGIAFQESNTSSTHKVLVPAPEHNRLFTALYGIR